MYLIKVRFESNIKGVYTEETETAEDTYDAETKYNQALNRWLGNLTGVSSSSIDNINPIEFSSLYKGLSERKPRKSPDYKVMRELRNNLKLHIIQELINLGNTNLLEGEQERKFEITMEEV